MLNKFRKYLMMLAVAFTVTAVTIPTTSLYVYADEDEDEREREEEEEREREEREREEEEEREREEREEQERREREERERKHRSGDIWIDADDTYIDVDDHTTLKAKVKAKGDYHIDWEISDSSVASLSDRHGDRTEVWGKKRGTTTVTAELYIDDKKVDSDSVTIHVDRDGDHHHDHHHHSDRYVTGLSVSAPTMNIGIGGTQKISYTVWPTDAYNQTVYFASSNPMVASVDAYGNVHGNVMGTAVITLRTAENGCTAAVTVNVSALWSALPKTSVTAPIVTTPVAPVVPVVISPNPRDPAYLSGITTQILTAAPFSLVNLTAMGPMSFDSNVAAALAMRPDVIVTATFPYDGHMKYMVVPAGYNLASRLSGGYVNWEKLVKNPKGILVNNVW